MKVGDHQTLEADRIVRSAAPRLLVDGLTAGEQHEIIETFAAWRNASPLVPWRVEIVPDTDDNGRPREGHRNALVTPFWTDEIIFAIYREAGRLKVHDSFSTSAGHDDEVGDVAAALSLIQNRLAPN